jgi:hypothetical protein
MSIVLTAEDVLCATNVASLQMLRKMQKGRDSDHGGRSVRSIRTRWADTIVGLMGEIALSRHLNQAWTPGGMEITIGDVGYRTEVRATDWEDGHLLIYKSDPDDKIFYLMIAEWGERVSFRPVGWIMAKHGKQQEFWRADKDPPCWWVPQNRLQPCT